MKHPEYPQALKVASAVCKVWDLNTIKNKSKEARYSHPRQVAMYALSTKYRWSQAAIGRFLGCHPSNVCHAVKRIKNLMETEPATKINVECVMQMLGGAK